MHPLPAEQLPPWFPALELDLEDMGFEPAELVPTLLDERPSTDWLLLGGPVPTSELHLWTAWMALERHERAGTMVARERDTEFLRLLSGTHHIRTAFGRAGLDPADPRAWLVRLPPATPADEATSAELPSFEWPEFLAAAEPLLQALAVEPTGARPEPSPAALVRLGILDSLEAAPPAPGAQELLAVAHVAAADLGD